MILNYPPRRVHYNASVPSEYNISQYIHMSDKGWSLYDFGSAFCTLMQGTSQCLYTHIQNAYLVLYCPCCINFMLYVCCKNVLYKCYIFSCCMKLSFFHFFVSTFLKLRANRSGLIREISWVRSILQSKEKNVILSCRLYDKILINIPFFNVSLSVSSSFFENQNIALSFFIFLFLS